MLPKVLHPILCHFPSIIKLMHWWYYVALRVIHNYINPAPPNFGRIEKLPKDIFWSIMKVPYPKNIHNMSQSPPNPGFRSVKAQNWKAPFHFDIHNCKKTVWCLFVSYTIYSVHFLTHFYPGNDVNYGCPNLPLTKQGENTPKQATLFGRKATPKCSFMALVNLNKLQVRK